jgi:hypothetical protein
LEDTRSALMNSSLLAGDVGLTGVGGRLHARLAGLRDRAAAGLAEMKQALADLPVSLGLVPNTTGELGSRYTV